MHRLLKTFGMSTAQKFDFEISCRCHYVSTVVSIRVSICLSTHRKLSIPQGDLFQMLFFDNIFCSFPFCLIFDYFYFHYFHLFFHFFLFLFLFLPFLIPDLFFSLWWNFNFHVRIVFFHFWFLFEIYDLSGVKCCYTATIA